jgi:hypothetical protein
MTHSYAGSNVFQAFRLDVDTFRLQCNKQQERKNYFSWEEPTSSDLTRDSDDISAPPAKLYVDHVYHDHSNERDPEEMCIEDDMNDEASPSSSGKRRKCKARGGVTVPFPEKLHDMLSNIEDDGHGHVISWQPHGRCFLVHKPEVFVKVVMPLYFNQTKLTSFQRQLNLYGFCRLTTRKDRGGYYHELFLKHRPFLCKRMIRTRVKGMGKGSKGVNRPSSEPNFYRMPFVKAVTPPSTPVQQATPLSPDVPSTTWLLEEDAVKDDEMQITFEGKTFHYLDTSFFDNIGQYRGCDLGSRAEEDFLAGFDMLY